MEFDVCGVGVGPGDPELVTLKALKKLKKSDVIFAPASKNGAIGLAFSVVRDVIDIRGKEVVELMLPMTRSESRLREARDIAARKMIESIEKGKKIAFVTLGDPMLYSTFTYLMSSILKLRPETRIEAVPGVSSVMASAAACMTPLGESDEKIAIVPAVRENLADIELLLGKVDTLVLMKVNRHFDEIVDILNRNNLEGRAVFISKTGREGESVVSDLNSLKGEGVDYFSTIIIRGRNE